MCGGGKGGDSTTQTTSQNSTATQSPPDYLDQAYRQLVGQAQGIANSPLQIYQGNTIAPFSGAQTQAFNQVQNAQGAANPYINAAAGSVGASQANLWDGLPQFSQQNIQQYENPYQQDVIDATMKQIGQLNAQQQSQLQGNAVANHALGGDRAGIAAASLANQQGLAAGQTLSQLNNQNYAQAQGEFNNQQASKLSADQANAWLNSQAGQLYSSLGNQALNTQLTGSQALLSTGNQQQSQAQAELNYPYQVFQQQQAYPYQASQYLANLLQGIGGVAGGTTTGSSTGTTTTSQSAPSLFSQILGGIAGGAGIAGQLGAFGGSGITSTPIAGADYSSYGADFGTLGSMGQSQASASNFLGPYSSTSGLTYNRGGIVGRRHLAGGGISNNKNPSNIPDFSVGFIPNSPPTGVRANFPELPKPPDVKGGGGGGGGGDDTLKDIGQVASIAAMFLRKGGVVPARASGGGIFSAMGAARRGAPKIAAIKSPDYLKTPALLSTRKRYDDGGGVGGLMQTAQNQSPIVQNNYQKFADMSPEQLQETSVRMGGSPQGGLAHQALQQKRMMPQASATTTQNAPDHLQVPQLLMGSAGFARGGVSRETYAFGGGDEDGISIPFPAPPEYGGMSFPVQPAMAEEDAAEDAARAASGIHKGTSGGDRGILPPVYQPSSDNITIPETRHHDPLPAAQHYATPTAEKPDPWNALTQAGFAIMAGKHANALQNIGEGALLGSKAYAKERNDASERTYRTGQLSDAVNKLNEEADYHRNSLNNEQEKLDQSSIKDKTEAEYRQGDLDLRNRTLQQDQWQIMSDPMGGGFVKMNKKTGEVVPVNSNSTNLDLAPTNDKGEALKGDEFLKTLPPQYSKYAGMIKGIATGQQAFPSTYALSKPLYANVIMPSVYAYNPKASGQMYQNIKAFETGKQGDQLKFMNTSVAHLDTAQELADALNNKDTKVLNRVANMWKEETGEDAPTNFDTARQIVGNEVMKAISNAGAGGVAEREELQKRFDKAGSPAQLKGAISTAQKLLVGQLSSIRKQYEYSTQQEDFLTQRLTPRTRSIFEKLDPDKPQGTDAATTFPNAPAIGTKKGGWTYNGGDPANPASWSK